MAENSSNTFVQNFMAHRIISRTMVIISLSPPLIGRI